MRARYCFMFFTLAGACSCAVLGIDEYSISARSSQEPEEISLRDLLQRGPDGNPNIILKDFSIFEDYVCQKKLLSGTWTKVWVPIVPSNGDEDVPDKSKAIRAFLFSEDIGSEKEVRERFDRRKLRGMVNVHAPKPGIIGSFLIKRMYPGTDSSKCIIIEEGREPAGMLKLALFGSGFFLLIGLTAGIWILAWQLDKVEVKKKPADKVRTRRSKQDEEEEFIPWVLPADEPDHRPQRS